MIAYLSLAADLDEDHYDHGEEDAYNNCHCHEPAESVAPCGILVVSIRGLVVVIPRVDQDELQQNNIIVYVSVYIGVYLYLHWGGRCPMMCIVLSVLFFSPKMTQWFQ